MGFGRIFWWRLWIVRVGPQVERGVLAKGGEGEEQEL